MNQRVQLLQNQIGKEKWQYEYPLMDWLKAQVIAVEEGKIEIQFTVEKYMLNPIGILHGGIMATMLDEVMGAACFTLGRPVGYATINMNVDYLSPAKIGEKVIAKGIVVRAGKTVVHVKAELVNEDEKLLAKATSNLIGTSVPLPI